MKVIQAPHAENAPIHAQIGGLHVVPVKWKWWSKHTPQVHSHDFSYSTFSSCTTHGVACHAVPIPCRAKMDLGRSTSISIHGVKMADSNASSTTADSNAPSTTEKQKAETADSNLFSSLENQKFLTAELNLGLTSIGES
ncbi:hypothetical protein KSS87_006835 [Heliosperma pusillum]|nr:hypothetical protein KSS87_006835 [Heliosperma pusillum]